MAVPLTEEKLPLSTNYSLLFDSLPLQLLSFKTGTLSCHEMGGIIVMNVPMVSLIQKGELTKSSREVFQLCLTYPLQSELRPEPVGKATLACSQVSICFELSVSSVSCVDVFTLIFI